MPRLLIVPLLLTQFYISNTNGASIITSTNKLTYQFEGKGIKLLQNRKTCNVSPSIIQEIKNYEPIVKKIIEEATKNNFKGRTYKELEKFVDKFNHRIPGSQILEDSIDYIMEKMREDGLENIHGEEAVVQQWKRGEEKAELLAPINKIIPILGLGTSVGTPSEGITADVWVVRTFDELKANASLAKGKIIVFNQVYTNYAGSVGYRVKGASEAARLGAIAVLVRSIADFSINTPHTGGIVYDSDVIHIPAACISIEDAELLYRIQESGERIKIYMKMLDYNLPFTTSRNAIGELKGSTKPKEIVIVSGHIDNWDVGQGAMDDGGGCFIATQALALLKKLGLIPKRTLRAIMWTAEELGLWGGQDYARHHKNEMGNIIAAFESDAGTFTPKGIDFAGSEEAGCIIIEILKLLAPLKSTEFNMYESVSTDITHMIKQGVPGLSLNNADDRYFWYHHTEADSMWMMDSEALDKGTAVWAVAAYVIADLSIPLPRKMTNST